MPRIILIVLSDMLSLFPMLYPPYQLILVRTELMLSMFSVNDIAHRQYN